MPKSKPTPKSAAKSTPKRKGWVGLVTVLLQMAAEGLRLAGEVTSARRVEAILAKRPKLSEAESRAYRRAVERLGR